MDICNVYTSLSLSRRTYYDLLSSSVLYKIQESIEGNNKNTFDPITIIRNLEFESTVSSVTKQLDELASAQRRTP